MTDKQDELKAVAALWSDPIGRVHLVQTEPQPEDARLVCYLDEAQSLLAAWDEKNADLAEKARKLAEGTVRQAIEIASLRTELAAAKVELSKSQLQEISSTGQLQSALEQLASAKEEAAQTQARLALLTRRIRNDMLAVSHQSMGRYRLALLEDIDGGQEALSAAIAAAVEPYRQRVLELDERLTAAVYARQDAQAELEAKSRDAKAYRFLRDVDPDAELPCVMIHKQNDWGSWTYHHLGGEELDAAIAASKEEGKS